MMTFGEFQKEFFPDSIDLNEVQDAYTEYFKENVAVGDGVTVCYWTDRNAGTVIKRTAKSLTIQQDKATLVPEFKPNFIVGGFAAHCTNQSEQKYTYAPNPDGRIFKAYWSEKKKGFYADKCLRVIAGRHEFYDYNF